jgi:acetyl-CoA synthetase
MLLLPNIRQLREAILALIKLGAVINPAATLLSEADLEDHFARGRIRQAIVAAPPCGRFARLPGDYTRIAVGAAPGWHDFADAAPAEFVPPARPSPPICSSSISPRAPRQSRSSCCTAIRAIRSGISA